MPTRRCEGATVLVAEGDSITRAAGSRAVLDETYEDEALQRAAVPAIQGPEDVGRFAM